MSLENMALAETGDLPIKHEGEVHNGKVRSVYWLPQKNSSRLIEQRYGLLPKDAQLGVMVISDRISAFDCNWKGEDKLNGVPGKGAALNAISRHWFNEFDNAGFAPNHIVDTPHPLVWIVERAQPILIEAIVRQYITGSMWRQYERGEREFCGIELPDGLRKDQKLSKLLITPTTKGTLSGIPGVPEKEDANLTRAQIKNNLSKFGFRTITDIATYEALLKQGFGLIRERLAQVGQIFVDTKFEFGYTERDREMRMIYIDEIGTPDSSRMWDAAAYAEGRVVENSKERFREFLKKNLDRDVLLNGDRMAERKALAASYRVPVEVMMEVSGIYRQMAERITGNPVPQVGKAREEILDSLSKYGIVK